MKQRTQLRAGAWGGQDGTGTHSATTAVKLPTLLGMLPLNVLPYNELRGEHDWQGGRGISSVRQEQGGGQR